MQNIDQALSSIFSMLSSQSEKVSLGKKIFDNLTQIKNDFEKYYEQANACKIKELESYLKCQCNLRGSIYEEDSITILLSYLINCVQQNNKERKTVLIIDDLDRIDPTHIFRILNVFASHNDYQATGKHKFDFDKIIVVCDVDNLRNIFHSKFGQSVDFSGYIDKFYDIEPFNYDNKNEVINHIGKFITSICNSNYSEAV